MIFIPAKYGSTRTPMKNFRPFYKGLSLLQISIIRSVSSDCGPVAVSSENIGAINEQLRMLPSRYRNAVDVHQRPAKLAKDPATILDVVADYITTLNPIPESVSVVLPTSPFGAVEYITTAWELFNSSNTPKLLSVSQAAKPPFNAWVDSGENTGEIELAFPDNPFRLTQSTACPDAYFSNGCISIYSTQVILGDQNFESTLGFKMPQVAAMDIDFEYQLELAQLAFPHWAKDIDLFDEVSGQL